MYLAVTSGALTPLCGQPSAKCWVTWLYSYDKSKKIWWAFWHQQMVPFRSCIPFSFSECSALCWFIVPYGFYFSLPQLIPFGSFVGLWLCACLRAVYQEGNSHIGGSIWPYFVLILLNKRVLFWCQTTLTFSFSIFYFICLFTWDLWKSFHQNILHYRYLHQPNKFSAVESVIEFFIATLFNEGNLMESFVCSVVSKNITSVYCIIKIHGSCLSEIPTHCPQNCKCSGHIWNVIGFLDLFMHICI